MIPQDLLAMAGGAPASPQGGGLPPELMQMAAAAAPQAPPQAPLHGGGSDGDPEGALRDAIDALTLAAQAAQDEQESNIILGCITKLQSILAKNQQEADNLIQGKASPAAVRKAAG